MSHCFCKGLIETLYHGTNALLVASVSLGITEEFVVVGPVNGGFREGLACLT